MQIKHNSHIIIVLFTIITFSLAEEWFMPDSNLISDSDFDRKIKEDKSTFKIVKFFSPHCVYCRYLKIAVDKLKHERQWSFAMYDFNCGWYPQFCMQNVRAASFPYTAIYNTEGDLDQQIHGFYPEHILKDIFQKIQQKCPKKQVAANIPQNIQNPPQNSLSSQPNVLQSNTNNHELNKQLQNSQKIQNQKIAQTQQKHQKQNTIQQPSSQKNTPNHQQVQLDKKIQANPEIKQQQEATMSLDEDSKEQKIQHEAVEQIKKIHEINTEHHNGQNQKESSFYKYAFYGICSICGIYYFFNLTQKQPNQTSLPSQNLKSNLMPTPIQDNKEQKNQQFENNNLIESLRDDEL